MKQLVSLFAALAIISSPAFAATTKKKTVVKTTTTTTVTPKTETITTHSNNGETHQYSASTTPVFSAGIALGTIDSKFFFGPRFMVEFPANLDGESFKFGAETAFLYGSSNSVNFWSIPLMANGSYLFKTNSSTLKPYIGAAMGLSIDHAGVSSSLLPNASSTNVHFAFLVKPGMSFGENRQWFVEVPVGTLFTGFALLPTFGMHF